MMKTELYGSKEYLTDNDSTLLVESGRVLIYLVPFYEGEKRGRKLFLGEMGTGGRIPGLLYRDPDNVLWRFQIMSLDIPAVLVSLPDEMDDRLEADFAKKAGIDNVDRIGFCEAVAEKYRMNQVKDDAFIYQVQKDSRYYYREGLREILREFDNDFLEPQDIVVTNRLYESISYICSKRHMKLRPYDEIASVCGDSFTLNDAARLSDFVIRQVSLNEHWYKEDGGILLGFMSEISSPVVLEPLNTHSYRMLDLSSGESLKIDKSNVAGILPFAYVLYRPLPDEPLSAGHIAGYILQELSIGDLIRYGVTAVCIMLLGVVLTLINEIIFDRFIPQGNMKELFQIGGLLLIFTLGSACFSVVNGIAKLRVTARARYDLQAAVYQRAFNLPQSVIASEDSAEISSRIMGFGEICANEFEQISAVIPSLCGLIIYLVIMIRYSGQLTAASLGLMAVYMLITGFLASRKAALAAERLPVQGKMESELFQELQGIEKVRSSGAENNLLYRYIGHLLRIRELSFKESKYGILINALDGFIPHFLTIVVFSTIVFSGLPLSIGEYAAFCSAFTAFISAFAVAMELIYSLMDIAPAWERMSVVLENVPEGAEGDIRPEKISGHISLDGIVFGYEEGQEKVLDNISVDIAAGEYIGIVGMSGGGKTTLLKMIMGFLIPDKGRIYYDDMDLCTLDKREVRKKMGVVLQNDNLITGTIADNIRILAPELTADEIWKILKTVDLEDDVKRMPLGIYTKLDSENLSISGGQKQRLIIARAIASDPRILIFDEATSALDNISQSVVCDAVKKLNATRIVVAHRLSTVKDCDRILVLNGGKVAEEGTYQELLEKGGIFARMAERQTA